MSLLLNELTELSQGTSFDVTLRLELEDAEPFPYNHRIKGFKGKHGAIFSINQDDVINLIKSPPVAKRGDIWLDNQGHGWRCSHSSVSNMIAVYDGKIISTEDFFRKNISATRVHREPGA